MMNKPHKHAAIIKAWADGALIQHRDKANPEWRFVTVPYPYWFENSEFRLAPVEKTYWFNVYKHKKTGKITIGEAHYNREEVLRYAISPTFESVEYIKTESFTVTE